jgi:penicillin-binding protein 1C
MVVFIGIYIIETLYVGIIIKSVRWANDENLASTFGRSEVLHELRVDYSVQRLPWTPLAEISPTLKWMVLYAEDQRFYQHRGVDWRALGVALFERLQGQGRRGASTLSMQLAARLDPRLTPLHGQRSLPQKLQQIRAALVLE